MLVLIILLISASNWSKSTEEVKGNAQTRPSESLAFSSLLILARPSLVPRPCPAFRHLQYFCLHMERAWERGYALPTKALQSVEMYART